MIGDISAYQTLLTENVWLRKQLAERPASREANSTSSEAESILRLAVSVAGLGLGRMDYLADTITLNDVASSIFDLPTEVAIPRGLVHSRFHPAEAAKILTTIKQVFDPHGSGLMAVDHRIVRSDGSVRWVSARKQILFDRDPRGAVRPVSGMLALIDITDRIAATEAVLASETKFRSIFENVTVGIATVTPGGRWLTANDTICRITGYTSQQLLLTKFHDVILCQDGRLSGVDMTESPVLVENYQAQTRAIRMDGSFVWIDLTIGRIQKNTQGLDDLIVVVQDISEKKKTEIDRENAEKRLSESEAQLRQLNLTLEARVAERTVERDRAWSNSYDLLCVIDQEGNLNAVNPAWTGILGWHPDDLVGRSLVDFNVSGANPFRPKAIPATSDTEQSRSETRMRHKDGSYRWISWVAATEGGLIYANGRDITAEINAADALARTEELLRQAQKMEAIGRLASGVAHDFNNILQIVVGGLELVMDEVEADAPGAQMVEVALTAAERGSTLTHSLLSYARKQVLEPRAIHLLQFLTDIRALLSRTLGPNIDIHVTVQETPVAVADPGQLQTALLNLAINAAHAMPAGGLLTFRAYRDESLIVIKVTDTGFGMNEVTMAQAVEPFFTTKGPGGTGLGLSMVQGFAEQSGGGFALSSELGKGTEVELRLPGAQLDLPPEPVDIMPLRGLGRLLVVDDSVDVLVTLSLFLERHGFTVVRAGNGAEAITRARAGERFDALITDFAMPGTNGIGLITAMRQIQSSLPALIITGFSSFTNTDTFPSNTLVLQKPFSRHTLIKAISAVMSS